MLKKYVMQEIKAMEFKKSQIYAHRSGLKFELWEDHSNLTLRYSRGYLPYIRKIIIKMFGNAPEAEFVCEAAVDAIYSHDLGKSSPYFQGVCMKNPEYSESRYRSKNSAHSMVGAIIYLARWIKKLDDFKTDIPGGIERMLWHFAYVISRHHSRLISFDLEKFREDIFRYLEDDGDYFMNAGIGRDELKKIFEQDSYAGCWTESYMEPETYILCRLLYSVMCYSDFCATTEFMTGQQVENRHDFDTVWKKYSSSESYLRTKRDADTELNRLRNEIFNTAERKYDENPGKHMYYLSAPCGSGKTNILVNIMLRSAWQGKSKKCFFVFPRNALVEQTGHMLDEFLTFGEDYIIKNSVTAIADDDEDDCDYSSLWLKYQFLNYPVVITSGESFFQILFGEHKADCMCLSQLVGSTIAIDEVQQYDANRWKEMSEMMSLYAELLDIRFVLSSATLPKLGKLFSGIQTVNLLDRNYMRLKVFRDRTQYDYSLLESDNPESRIIEIMDGEPNKKYLVMFLFKKSAVEFYRRIKDRYQNVELMTGDTPKKKRQEIMKRSKKENMILVGTSVLGTGCDIDFEVGFANRSLLEEIEQFLGRLARNGMYIGKLYLFEKDNPAVIYKDVRTGYSFRNEKCRKLFEEKEYDQYYDMVMADVEKDKSRTGKDGIRYFRSLCGKLKFSQIADIMKVVKSNSVRAFIICDGETDELIAKFKELTGPAGAKIPYAEKKVKMLSLSEKMDSYMINITKKQLKEEYKEEYIYGGISFVHSYENSTFI